MQATTFRMLPEAKKRLLLARSKDATLNNQELINRAILAFITDDGTLSKKSNKEYTRLLKE